MKLNPVDREDGLVLLQTADFREKARRNPQSKLQWVGIRADAGVVNSGRWAFCVWNETGGNLRVGWSCEDASLKLGTDSWGFGYGGTATKSHAGQFTKFGQTYGQGDAITCLLDLDRKAILYMKNGRDIPGDAFTFGKELVGWPLFPHIYTKEATFSVSFDGRGGAPPLTGGYKWIASAGKALVHSRRRAAAGSTAVCEAEAAAASQPDSKFVLTPYGWRTLEEAGNPEDKQEWRSALDSYVKHFTSLLELEYEAEREAVRERVQKKSPGELEVDGVGMGGLNAEFEPVTGRVTLWSDQGPLPFLSEIARGRAVLLSTDNGGVDVDDATKTICCEVENFQEGSIILSTQYERLPEGRTATAGRVTWRSSPVQTKYRIDLGPNIVAYRRIDLMLSELQRCLGVAQASGPKKDKIQAMNCNMKLTGLLLPGTALANALYSDITESTAAASKWDPLQRPAPNPEADISRAARERDIGSKQYTAKGPAPTSAGRQLNESQRLALQHVLANRRRFTLIQGPPGTGKTTTAISIICGWLASHRGPVLASAFSNRGTDNLAAGLHLLGVRVVRVGLCPPEMPYSLETLMAECGAQRGDKGLQRVLQGVDVVAATCIGCGMGPLDKVNFPYVVVDEAAQVIEPAVLLPLGKGAVQAVLVGDQCQLPATVLSQEAQQQGLDISMFDRLLSMGMEYQFLAQQYRMHPKICSFPSWRFYRGELRSGVRDADRQSPRGLPFKPPLAFVHVDTSEVSGGMSKKNVGEANCVTWLAGELLRLLPSQKLSGDEIGIITPYAAQVSEIRRSLPYALKNVVQVSSVDAFQGCEKEFILLSLVRSNPHGAVGFVSDWRRLNVAITRARCACILVGHLPTWLDADSALLRDWIGFHSGKEAAEFRMFHSMSLLPLPMQLQQRVVSLQQEFARQKPAAAALPRISVAARDVMGLGKAKRQILEAGRTLASAVSSRSETALRSALGQAMDAGVGDTEILEGQMLLWRLSSERELADAIRAEDSAAVTAALGQAKEAGVEAHVLKEGEAALHHMDARRALREAMEGEPDEQRLRDALGKAGKSGLPKHELVAAQEALRRTSAANALHAAIASEDLAALKAAMAIAEPMRGMDKALLEQARQLQERNEAEAEEILMAAIAMADPTPGRRAAANRLASARGAEAEAAAAAAGFIEQVADTGGAPEGAEPERPAKRQRVGPAPDKEAQRQWALCLIELSVLSCRKAECMEASDWEEVHNVKMLEVRAGARMADAKQQAMGNLHGIDIAGRHAELEQLKHQAVAQENFELAASLKAQQLELQRSLGSSAMQVQQELEAVRAEKAKAVEQEQFERAAELRRKEHEISCRLPANGPALEAERQAVEGALHLLVDTGPEVLMLAFDPGVAACAQATGRSEEEFWVKVTEDLHALL